MNPDQVITQYCIEDRLLLKFLIVRYSEMLETDERRLDQIWAGLGMVGLHQNRELATAFETLVSSDSYTFQEILTSSIDLFLAELHRLDSTDTYDHLAKTVERRPLTHDTARKFLVWSWCEGRIMYKTQDLRFYMVWEVITWLGLSSNKDREYVEEFDTKCRLSNLSSETRLECGLEIVKSAMFHREIDKESLRDILSRHKIDKE